MTDRALWAVLFAAAWLAGGARAQEEPADPCVVRCEGDTLRFCDAGSPATLDCAELGERCGALSAELGDDCLLGEGAACDPGYAGGFSRCDRAAGLFCIDETCQVAVGPPPAEGPLAPTPSSRPLETNTASGAFGCQGCAGSSAALLVVPAVWTRRRRR